MAMSKSLLDFEVARCRRISLHARTHEDVKEAAQQYDTTGCCSFSLTTAMDVMYNTCTWHMRRHFQLAPFNIKKLQTVAEAALQAVRAAPRWDELSIVPEIIFLREDDFAKQNYKCVEDMLAANTSHRMVKRDEQSGEPSMFVATRTKYTGVRTATHVLEGGSVYDVRFPRFQLAMTLTPQNRAFVDEVARVVSMVVGKLVTCIDTNLICGGKAQARHCDWNRDAHEWSDVFVALYFPDGGAIIDSSGDTRCVCSGGVVVFNGYDYVHAGGPEHSYDRTRVHMVFVPYDERHVHSIELLRPLKTNFADSDVSINGERDTDPLVQRYNRADSDLRDCQLEIQQREEQRAAFNRSIEDQTSRALGVEQLVRDGSGAARTRASGKRSKHTE